MKLTFKKILSLAVLLSVWGTVSADCSTGSCSTSSDDCAVIPCFNPRSVGRNVAAQVTGMVARDGGHTHRFDETEFYGTFSIRAGYERSFRGERMAGFLFGADAVCSEGCDGATVKIQGSNVASRDAKAWLADYFYLPSDFKGSFSVSPRISNVVVGFDAYMGLEKWLWEGTYAWISAPVVHSRWDLNFAETVDAAGTNSHIAGYFNAGGIANASLLKSFSSYAAGGAIAASVDTGITFNGLKYGRIQNCASTKTGLADLRGGLGWNFWQDEDYHLGFNIQASAPTGSKGHCCGNLFEAKVGKHHWELGGGLTGHYTFWRSDDESKMFSFNIEAALTHMFKHNSIRSFDLKNGANSRYMLAAKMAKATTANFGGVDAVGVTSPTAGSFQFAGEYTPVINLSTLEVEVSAGVQADIAAWFSLTWCGFNFDLGYNFWAQSCEKIECPSTCDSDCKTPDTNICDASQANTWALKGDAHEFGFFNAGSANTANGAVALSASQSKATIHSGTNLPLATETPPITPNFQTAVTSTTATSAPAVRNFGVDNAKFAVAGATVEGLRFAINSGAGNNTGHQIKTSIQPIFLSCNDLNLQRSKGISHKVFGGLTYTFDRESWVPYIGIGGSAEFGGSDDCCKEACGTTATTTTAATDCSKGCPTAATSKWDVFVKIGVSVR